MKLLLVIVPILAVFTADCWAFSNEPGRQQTSDTPLVFPSGTETLEEWQKFGGRLETLDSTDNEKEEEILYVRKGKGSICKAKTTCDLLGGSCVTNATLCSGRLVAKGCKGTNCQCCVPDTIEAELKKLKEELQSFREGMNSSTTKLSSELQIIINSGIKQGTIEAELKKLKEELQSFREGMNSSDTKLSSELQIIKNNMDKISSTLHSGLKQGCPISKGYFIAPGSNQCLKVFLDTLRTWPQADQKCKAEGLVLVKPYDAVSLNKYMLERYYAANQWYWVNAKGDGTTMKWQRSDGLGLTKLENSSPLYVSTPKVSTSYCLQIAPYDSYLKSKPGQVYYTSSCTGDREYALCELLMG